MGSQKSKYKNEHEQVTLWESHILVDLMLLLFISFGKTIKLKAVISVIFSFFIVFPNILDFAIFK